MRIFIGRQYEWFDWCAHRPVVLFAAECRCCGVPRVRYLKCGLCSNCYHRWHRRGFAGPGPGPSARVPMAENAREYADIITTLSARRAAEQLGRSEREIVRWRRALREAS
jgi:hypothetical protein